MIRGLSSSGLPALLKTAPWGEPFRVSGVDYLLCGPWEPPGPEGRGEGDGRDGAAAGGEDGLLGALAEAAEKEADLLLCDKNERKFISGMADRQVKENYQSLLRSVQDDRLRKEIKNILDSDE